MLLYGDKEHASIVDGARSLARLAADAATADLVLVLGISFEQAASCEYLRAVADAVRPSVPLLLVNPDEDAEFAARSALPGDRDVDLRALRATSDDLFRATGA